MLGWAHGFSAKQCELHAFEVVHVQDLRDEELQETLAKHRNGMGGGKPEA